MNDGLRDKYEREFLERNLGLFRNPENGQEFGRFLVRCRARRTVVSTQTRYAQAVRLFDNHLAGRRFPTAGVADVDAFFADLAPRYAANTTHMFGRCLGAFFRWLWSDTPMPRAMNDAFKVARGPHRTLVVDPEEFWRILKNEAAQARPATASIQSKWARR